MPATDFKDYYATLGIANTASPEEIKKAYRKLARQYHPDLNPGDAQAEARFKDINEAYEVLSNPESRGKYDQYGQYWKEGGTSRAPSPGAGAEGVDFGQYANFEDFLGDLLGGRATTSGSRGGQRAYTYRTARPPAGGGYAGYEDNSEGNLPGSDVEGSVTLSMAEAFQGVRKRLRVGEETIEVRIPPGAREGSRVRIRGKGRPSPFGGQRGDLYLTVQIHSHPFFRLEEDNLVCEVPITPDEAVLGARVDVPTPDGPVSVNIPPGTHSGQALRLRGKGWQKPDGGRGDQIVRVQIVPPKDIDPVEREYYEKIRDNRTFNPRSGLQEVQL
ncbi:MAG: J domain-containing protein [Gemmatimonadaceae bacterium]|nr:J domain-containing protein [Gloeobacterales cyanobacterium ES-bin-141]